MLRRLTCVQIFLEHTQAVSSSISFFFFFFFLVPFPFCVVIRRPRATLGIGPIGASKLRIGPIGAPKPELVSTVTSRSPHRCWFWAFGWDHKLQRQILMFVVTQTTQYTVQYSIVEARTQQQSFVFAADDATKRLTFFRLTGGCSEGLDAFRFFFKYYFFFFFFFSSLISLIADGPHHYHPACGHKGSSHLSPVHALQCFIAMQVQHSYNSSTNG